MIGIAISILFLGAVTIGELSRHQNPTGLFQLIGSLLPFALLFALLIAVLFAAIFLFFGAVIKPIWIALFCSVERFEQEYGP